MEEIEWLEKMREKKEKSLEQAMKRHDDAAARNLGADIQTIYEIERRLEDGDHA